MPCGPCLKHGCFQIVVGLGYCGEEMMQRHSCESELGRKGRGGGGVDGQYVEKRRE